MHGTYREFLFSHLVSSFLIMCAPSPSPSAKAAGKGPPPLPTFTGTHHSQAMRGAITFTRRLIDATLSLGEEMKILESLSVTHPDWKKEASIDPEFVSEYSVVRLLADAVSTAIEIVLVQSPEDTHASQRQHLVHKAGRAFSEIVMAQFICTDAPNPTYQGWPEGSTPIDNVKLSFERVGDMVKALTFNIAILLTEECPAGACTSLDISFRILKDINAYFVKQLVYRLVHGTIKAVATDVTGSHNKQKLQQLTDDAIIQCKWESMCMTPTDAGAILSCWSEEFLCSTLRLCKKL